MNSVMERLVGSCRPELLDWALVRSWRQPMIIVAGVRAFFTARTGRSEP